MEIEERGVKLRLTVVDTPGFGDAIDNSDSFQQIIKYIDQQFDRCVVKVLSHSSVQMCHFQVSKR